MSPTPDSEKVAVITGASQGIGAGLVGAFRRAGYAVVATSRSIRPSEESQLLTVQRPSAWWSRRWAASDGSTA
jgi:NAD(P)-dependent dehydrogenase (short-subunit alcohol dehydrogenase family)